MKRIRFACIIVLTLLSGLARGTPGLLPLEKDTVRGEWVGLDGRTGDVLRLRVVGRVAMLAVVAGPKQPEFLFQSKDLVSRDGRVSASFSERPNGPKITIEGRGRANEHSGVMTVKIGGLDGRYAELCREEVEFVKEPAGFSVAELLARNDDRAKVLMDSAGKTSSKSPPGEQPEGKR